MSAWYVFTALGFYPVTPGSLEYVIGSPFLPRATLNLPGKPFTVIAEGLSEANLYIQSAKLNGRPYDKAYVRHQDLVRGGTLVFTMGPRPSQTLGHVPGQRSVFDESLTGSRGDPAFRVIPDIQR